MPNEPMTDPMPVFVLKAKDFLALQTVALYVGLCDANGLDAQGQEVRKAWAEMCDWRARHPDLIKMPDHQHVPAARS